MSFFKTWLFFLGISLLLSVFIMLFFKMPVDVGFRWFFMLFIFLPIFFYNSVKRFFDEQKHKKEMIKYEEKQRQNRDFEYEMELNRKRKELQIEFEHYAKIARLHAEMDESKMRLIAQRESDFKRSKDSDLDSLNAQIERMRNM